MLRGVKSRFGTGDGNVRPGHTFRQNVEPMKACAMSILMILLTILLPPLPVAIKEGFGLQLLLNVLLTLIGWLPGVVHAFWVQTRGNALEL